MPEIIPNWHPVFVHFTIALFSVSTLLFILANFANLTYKEKLLNAAYINLWVGCLFTFGTIAMGFYAYNTVAHDEPSHAAMTDHKNWALVTAIFFLILTIWSVKLYKKDDKLNKLFMISLIVATTLLSVTGFKGGEAVYRYGLGVMSLPNTDSHKHNANESPGMHGDEKGHDMKPHSH
ncbi:MAG: DUF2231 domain-containing protein [Sphingobacteriia bacterium]|nr:DUF2231 domain-containing protein [Sphingobacteriia bacterium]